MSRPSNALREVKITPNWSRAPLASVLYEQGQTRVLCTVSLENSVPPFREGKGGWITAEYGMLPGCTPRRIKRPIGKPDGRQTEIQRLIGRALRAGFNMEAMGARTLTVDCDVLEADGGTRTASITGGYVALCMALDRLIAKGDQGLSGPVKPEVFVSEVTAVSVGLFEGKPYLDLDYALDSRADVDLNVVMDGQGRFIELQGTGEQRGMARDELNVLLDLASAGIEQLRTLQRTTLETQRR